MQHSGHLQDLATKPKLTSACDCRTTHYLIIGSHHLPSTVDDTNFAYKEGSQALIFQTQPQSLNPNLGTNMDSISSQRPEMLLQIQQSHWEDFPFLYWVNPLECVLVFPPLADRTTQNNGCMTGEVKSPRYDTKNPHKSRCIDCCAGLINQST
jgi:hypothetical protein